MPAEPDAGVHAGALPVPGGGPASEVAGHQGPHPESGGTPRQPLPPQEPAALNSDQTVHGESSTVISLVLFSGEVCLGKSLLTTDAAWKGVTAAAVVGSSGLPAM